MKPPSDSRTTKNEHKSFNIFCGTLFTMAYLFIGAKKRLSNYLIGETILFPHCREINCIHRWYEWRMYLLRNDDHDWFVQFTMQILKSFEENEFFNHNITLKRNDRSHKSVMSHINGHTKSVIHNPCSTLFLPLPPQIWNISQNVNSYHVYVLIFF